MSGAHAHWVRSLGTSIHATKGKKCAKGTGSLITLNCGKGVNHGVTCTLVLRSCTVENQLALFSTTLAHFFLIWHDSEVSSDPIQCACALRTRHAERAYSML